MNDNDLYDIIKKQFQTYTDDVVKDIKKSARKISLNAVREVKQKSPQSDKEYSQHYSQHWSRDFIEKDDGVYIMVKQTKKPTLTHLLEDGHKSRNGSRVEGIKHIAPVEEKANEEFSKKIDEIIQKHSKD